MEEQLYLPKRVLIGPQALEGELLLPPRAQALIVFAHGSGSGRRSPRNLQVAHALNEQRLGTLLFDLLRPEEALDRANVFDVELLGRRVTGAIDWLDRRPSLAALPLGLFGASTGAAAARPERVFAVVSRGGRPDLAGNALPRVGAPTLLIVGGADTEVLALNRHALSQLTEESELAVVPDATHLFEERGALERVTQLAGNWFIAHLPDNPSS